MKKLVYILILVAMIFPSEIMAQCAMCKAVVESNAQTGDNVVAGVNNAILYLMGIPYALVGIIGYFWYRNYRNTAEGE